MGGKENDPDLYLCPLISFSQSDTLIHKMKNIMVSHISYYLFSILNKNEVRIDVNNN